MKYAKLQKQMMIDIIPPRFLKHASRLFGRTIPLKKSVSWYRRRLKKTYITDTSRKFTFGQPGISVSRLLASEVSQI